MSLSYPIEAFDRVPSAKEIVTEQIDLDALPDMDDVKALASWTEEMLERFEREADFFEGPPKQDRSGAMGAFTYLAAEHGWSDEQIMAALLDIDDRWGKYKNRRDRMKRLVDFINRARQKIGYEPAFDIDLSKLLSQPDKALIDDDGKLVWGFQDFVNAEFKIDWLLEGLLPMGGVGLVTGYPGTGKTQFGIQLGAYLATGADKFLKWENKGGAKKVLFVSLEMGKPPLNLFMSTIGGSYPDKQVLNRNFLVAPLGVPIPIDTKQGQAFFNNLLDEHMPDVLIIDSLQRSISKEMTDELAAKNLMEYVALLTNKYRCAVVMIHHNRKKANDSANKQITSLSDVYGSVFFTANSDFVLSLDKLNPSLLAVHSVKNRLGPEHEPFEIYRNDKLHFGFEFEEMQSRLGTKGEGGGLLGI